jgi:hypothetical protein
MKVKQLKTIIRKMVVEEVKKQVNEIFIKEQVKPSRMVATKPVKREKVNYTDNSALNKVLNETVGFSETEEYPTMGGKAYTTEDMSEVLGYGEMASPELKRDQVAAQTLAEKGVTPEQVGDGVVNALTRDYSSLMKVMNKGK